jgi:hypothetical protein
MTRLQNREDPGRKSRGFGAFAAAFGFSCFLSWVPASAQAPAPPAKAPAGPVAAAKAPAAPAEPPVEPEYVYSGTSRDPFIPLAGGPAALAMPASEKEPGAFNPSGLDLKGLTRSRTGRWAVLVSSTGDEYIVENGKILDGKRKTVEGYVGIIKEKSLVLIGPNNQVTELKLKRDQEKKEGKKK